MPNREFSKTQISPGKFSCAEDTTPNNPPPQSAHPVTVTDSTDSDRRGTARRARFNANPLKLQPTRKIGLNSVLERLATSAYFLLTARSIASPYPRKYHDSFMFAPESTAQAARYSRLSLLLRTAATIFAIALLS